MLRSIYNLAMGLGIVLALPFFAVRLLRPDKRALVLSRLGLGGAWLPSEGSGGAVWTHALSVGEVNSALPLVRELQQRLPRAEHYLSVATAAGLERARAGLGKDSGVRLFLRPLDLVWAARRLAERIKPGLHILVEGDIWPNWQWILMARGTPCVLVNSRVSPRSFRGYRRLGRLGRELFMGFERIMAQSPVDRERLMALGVPPELVAVKGNLKFDSALKPLEADVQKELARQWGLGKRQVLVAGSTHRGEEDSCLAAYKGLLPKYPGLAMVIAPRDVSRGQEVAALFRRAGLAVHRLSQGEPPDAVEVLVLDQMGRLAQAYALALAAFVGGSLINDGGHNLLEAAAQGAPVIFGPHTQDFQHLARGILEAGAGMRVQNMEELGRAWGGLLADGALARRMGEKGLAFCTAHRGAVGRVADEVVELYGTRGK